MFSLTIMFIEHVYMMVFLLLAMRRVQSVADLGFGKDGCPIHQKGAPEGSKPPTCAPAEGLGSLPQKI